jgi:putative ABC transport system permease protein
VANADRVIALLENDRRALLTASREQDYYATSGKVYAVLGQVGMLISVIVTIGAVFSDMNTMYTAVPGRMREVGALRALGFSRGSVLASFRVESLLLSASGASSAACCRRAAPLARGSSTPCEASEPRQERRR